MADQDKSQQTEEATPRRKEKLRDQGKLIKSQDVTGVAVVAAAAMTLATMGSSMGEAIVAIALRCFRLGGTHEPLVAVAALRPALAKTVLPVALAALVAAVGSSLAQTKGFFKLDQLQPKPERFNPLPALKRMLPGKESGGELLKQSLKLLGIGFVVYRVIVGELPHLLGLGASAPQSALVAVGSLVRQVAISGIIAFALVAALDYALARRKWNEEAKMSKRDIKDEHKQQEGDPLVKRRMRQRMREAVGRRGGDVKDATVVVTNPTHISIALRYDPTKDAAPIVLAKGIDRIALRMRDRARRHGVPIVENKPFARAMHKDAKIGEPLPADLFGPAAEVIAHVMRLRGQLPAEGAAQ